MWHGRRISVFIIVSFVHSEVLILNRVGRPTAGERARPYTNDKYIVYIMYETITAFGNRAGDPVKYIWRGRFDRFLVRNVYCIFSCAETVWTNRLRVARTFPINRIETVSSIARGINTTYCPYFLWQFTCVRDDRGGLSRGASHRWKKRIVGGKCRSNVWMELWTLLCFYRGLEYTEYWNSIVVWFFGSTHGRHYSTHGAIFGGEKKSFIFDEQKKKRSFNFRKKRGLGPGCLEYIHTTCFWQFVASLVLRL